MSDTTLHTTEEFNTQSSNSPGRKLSKAEKTSLAFLLFAVPIGGFGFVAKRAVSNAQAIPAIQTAEELQPIARQQLATEELQEAFNQNPEIQHLAIDIERYEETGLVTERVAQIQENTENAYKQIEDMRTTFDEVGTHLVNGSLALFAAAAITWISPRFTNSSQAAKPETLENI